MNGEDESVGGRVWVSLCGGDVLVRKGEFEMLLKVSDTSSISGEHQVDPGFNGYTGTETARKLVKVVPLLYNIESTDNNN